MRPRVHARTHTHTHTSSDDIAGAGGVAILAEVPMARDFAVQGWKKEPFCAVTLAVRSLGATPHPGRWPQQAVQLKEARSTEPPAPWPFHPQLGHKDKDKDKDKEAPRAPSGGQWPAGPHRG